MLKYYEYFLIRQYEKSQSFESSDQLLGDSQMWQKLIAIELVYMFIQKLCKLKRTQPS